MPVITDIQRQKKRETRYSIFLDGIYSFSLSDLELSTSDLAIGREVTPAEVVDWQQQSEDGKAYNRALDYISYRKRSRREVEVYLKRHGYAPEVTTKILARLVEYKLVDDADLATSWVADRKALKPRSRRRLEQELRAKGVTGEDLEAGLAEVTDEDEMGMLKEIITKKINLPRYNQRDKLISYLVSQGFAYGLIKQILEETD